MDNKKLLGGPSLGDYVSASPSLKLRNESRRNDVLSRSVAVTSARHSNNSGAPEGIGSAPAGGTTSHLRGGSQIEIRDIVNAS